MADLFFVVFELVSYLLDFVDAEDGAFVIVEDRMGNGVIFGKFFPATNDIICFVNL